MGKQSRRRQEKRRLKVKLPNQLHGELKYMRVTLMEDDLHIEILPDYPPDRTAENSSQLQLPQIGYFVDITWVPEKPVPGDSRNKLLVQVMKHLSGEADVDYAIGHIPPEAIEEMVLAEPGLEEDFVALNKPFVDQVYREYQKSK